LIKILTFETIVAQVRLSFSHLPAHSFRGEHNPVAAVSGLLESAHAST